MTLSRRARAPGVTFPSHLRTNTGNDWPDFTLRNAETSAVNWLQMGPVMWETAECGLLKNVPLTQPHCSGSAVVEISRQAQSDAGTKITVGAWIKHEGVFSPRRRVFRLLSFQRDVQNFKSLNWWWWTEKCQSSTTHTHTQIWQEFPTLVCLPVSVWPRARPVNIRATWQRLSDSSEISSCGS